MLGLKTESVVLVLPFCLMLLVLTRPAGQPEIRKGGPFPWRFELVAELDTADPDASVTGFRDVTVDADGRVYLIDRILQGASGKEPFFGIHQFGPDGKWMANLSREGDGPGEFQSLWDLDALADGRLMVYTARVRRVALLAPDGGYVDSFILSASGAEKVEAARADRVWTEAFQPQDRRDPYGSIAQTVSLIGFDTDTRWTKTWSQAGPWRYFPIPGRPGFAFGLRDPCAQIARWTVDATGILWMTGPECEDLVRISPDGEVLSETPIRIPPIRLESEQKKAVIERAVLRYRESDVEARRTVAPDMADYLQAHIDEMSPIQRLWAVDQHGLLIDRQLMDPESDYWWEQEGRYMALMPDGTCSEEAVGPPALWTVQFGYAISMGWTDEGLPTAKLYRLVWNGPGGP